MASAKTHVPKTADEFLAVLRKSSLCAGVDLDAELARLADAAPLPAEPELLASLLVRAGLLSFFQADRLMQGKSGGYTFDKYEILEYLGQGGMGRVFLAQHTLMRRLVALKLLPASTKTADPAAVERFLREARAVAALDHPNIVRAHDLDHHNNVYYMVMEYVEGSDLQGLVRSHGPLDILRAAHYVAQTARGLHHAHQAGWVHRDIKPGNLLLNRQGTVKILDMGLARLFRDQSDALTKDFGDKSVLGTLDYLSPEQVMNSHDVDTRTDIYSLGATFYFLLTGAPPFPEGTVAQKLLWHQLKDPAPVGDLRPEVPEHMALVVETMMAKSPADRYQDPLEVVEALAPWTETLIAPPPDEEMPRLSPKVARLCRVEAPMPAPTTADGLSDPSAPSLGTSCSAVKTAKTPRSKRWFTEKAARATEVLSATGRGRNKRRRALWFAGGVALLVVALGVTATWVRSNMNRPLPPPAADGAPPPIIPPEKALLCVGKTCTVEMTVKSTGLNQGRTMFFLNSRQNYREPDNFAVVVPNSNKVDLAALQAEYGDKIIRVTGNIVLFDQRAEIIVTDLEQIRMVSQPTP
jgi:serine/threonine protein kinase